MGSMWQQANAPRGLRGNDLSRAYNRAQPDDDFLATHYWAGWEWHVRPEADAADRPGGSFHDLAVDQGYSFHPDPPAPAETFSAPLERFDSIAARVIAQVQPEPETKPVKPYKIGQLAELLGRKTHTLECWIRDGLFPESPIRSANGKTCTHTEQCMCRRYWPIEYVEQILELWRATNRKMCPLFTERCFKLFEEMAS